MNYPTTAAVAAKLEQYARTIAPAVAFIIALVVHTYWLGYRLGRMIHTANDWLAAHWPTRPATAQTSEPLAAVIAETGATVIIAPIDQVAALRASGLSQRAIAAHLGVSRATVRRRLAMA